jgi:glycosyltransferase involved in cell wall biosynthesis
MGKKILVFCGGGFVFGAEIVTLSILEELVNHGHEVHCIVSGWNNGEFIKRLNKIAIPNTKVNLGFLYITKPKWTIDTILNYPKAISTIRRLMKDFQPDLTYHITYRTLIMTYYLVRQHKNILFVFDPHHGKLNQIYFKIIDRILYKYVAVSKAISKNLNEIGASTNKIMILRNGVKIDPRPTYQPPLGSILRYGIFGQIISRKGHLYIFKAIKILKEKGYVFKLIIVGTGDPIFIEKLKQLASDEQIEKYIEWKKFETDRNRLYSLVDVVLVPSITIDPLPTTAMEAGLFFKPAIVTNIGGLPEIVKDRETGLIVNPESAQEIALAMERFILCPTDVEAFGINAHSHVVQKFDVKKNVLKLVHLINDLQ